MLYAILRDKERLDAGEPTEITVSYTRQEVAAMGALAAVLGQTLLQSGKEIDVTSQKSGTAKNQVYELNMMLKPALRAIAST